MTTHRWSAIDWTQSTTAIATELSISISTVSKARHRYAPETLRAYSRQAPRRANRADPAYEASRGNLEQHRTALRDANHRITTLTKELADALARAHRYDAELDRLRRAPQPATQPAPPAPRAPRAPRPARSPATQEALDTALDTHPDLAAALAGTLKDTWHNPGAASGADGTNNHP